MRTLKEEIEYCRKEGFHRNTIELSTMYSWLGERTIEDDELKKLREKVFQLQGESMGMQHRINHLEAVLRKHKIDPDAKAAPEGDKE